jgi:hypothetical protein
MKTLKTSLVASILLLSSAAQASITSYTSSAAFDAALSGLSSTSYAAAATTGFPSGSTGVYGSGATAYASYGANPIGFNGGSILMPAGYIWSNPAIFGNPSANAFGTTDYAVNWGLTTSTMVTLNFSTPVYGFYIDGGVLMNSSTGGTGPTNLVFTIGTDTSTVNLSDVMMSNSFVSTGQPITFMGFSAPIQFSSVAIANPQGNLAIQDITVATSLGATSASSLSVPEPSTLALLAAGPIGVTRFRRKTRTLGQAIPDA